MADLSLEEITKIKSKIRKKTLAKRRAFSGMPRLDANVAIWQRFKEEFVDSKVRMPNIMFYYSFGSEVFTHSIIGDLSMQGYNIFLPKMRGEEIVVCKYKEGEMKLGKHRILEPITPPIKKPHLDMIIVPGIAFDKERNRLGWGKGYYDRFLAKEEYKGVRRIAPAYSFQVLDNLLPCLDHDQKVDVIITEQKIIKAGAR